jgi:hypothetical protein
MTLKSRSELDFKVNRDPLSRNLVVESVGPIAAMNGVMVGDVVYQIGDTKVIAGEYEF